MTRLIEARVIQKAGTIEELNNSDLKYYDGEQVFVKSDVDNNVISYKVGVNGKKFNELPYPDFYAKGKVTPSSVFTGLPSGVYIPTLNGLYNGTVTVNLGEGYQVLHWDGSTLQKVVYPFDYNGIVYGGVIDDSADLSNPTEPIWYIASAGEYNTVPPTTLGTTSILTWDGVQWSNIPFELEVRGDFLVADNVQELRNITQQVASLLTNGTYKGLTLLGYYTPGDTPAPINYYISDTTEVDDGGSVFEVGGIKLEHDFKGYTNVLYYGCILDGITDNLIQFQRCLNKKGVIHVDTGSLAVSDTLNLDSDTTITGNDKDVSTIMWKDNSVSPGHTSDENFLLTISAKNNISFENITLDANGFNQDDIFRNSILELRDSSNNIRINNVYFRNAFDTLAYGGFALVAWYGGADNVTINNIYFDKIGQSDLGLFEGQNWQVSGFYSTNNTYMCINIETSNQSKYLRNINITNVVASDCKRSIISLIYNAVATGVMENINISNVVGTRISNNDNQVGCIRFRGGKSINLSNITLNDSGGTAIRMTVDSNQSVENINISNVIINNITSSLVGYGISVEGTSAYPCKNITFENIKITGSVSAGFNSTYLNNSTIKGVTVQSPKLVVRGFEIKNSKFLNFSDNKSVNTLATGIGLTDCDTVTFSENNVIDAVGVGIYVSGITTNLICGINSVSDTRSTKLTITAFRLETSINNPRVTLFGNNFYGILNPVDGNMISIASNIVQDNIVQIGNSSTNPFRSSTTLVKGIVKQAISLPSGSTTDQLIQALKDAGLMDT